MDSRVVLQHTNASSMISLLFSFHSSWLLKKPASSPRRSSAAVRTLLTVIGSTSALRTMSRNVFSRMAFEGGAVLDEPDSEDIVVQIESDRCCMDLVHYRRRVAKQFTRSCPTFDVWFRSAFLAPASCITFSVKLTTKCSPTLRLVIRDSFTGQTAFSLTSHIAIASSQAEFTSKVLFLYKGDVIFCNFQSHGLSTTFDVTIVGKGVENILNISKNFYTW